MREASRSCSLVQYCIDREDTACGLDHRGLSYLWAEEGIYDGLNHL